MRQNLNRLLYFVTTLDAGTYTAAAERLGVSKAVVSKQVQLLEAEIGQSLLLRNTRRIAPTEAGQQLYARARTALSEVEAAYAAVTESDHQPRGHLRITAPVDLGLDLVSPLVTRFQERHPQVQIDLQLSDEKQDLVANRLDLSFQVGWLQETSNIARKLRNFREIVVTSPSTAAKHTVRSPQDLGQIPLALNSNLGDRAAWSFTGPGGTQDVALKPTMTMNITLGVLQAVHHGTYFTILPDFLVADALAEGRLVQWLPDWALRTGGIYTVTPSGQLRSNALKAFLATVRKEFTTG